VFTQSGETALFVYHGRNSNNNFINIFRLLLLLRLKNLWKTLYINFNSKSY
jgi:hypothetical protein